MDSRNQIIEQVLTQISQLLDKDEDTEAILSFDPQRGQYILMSDGWVAHERFYHPVVHLELKKDGIIWLRCDNTDLGIGEMLIEKGIPKHEIIPAFYSPQMRKLILS